MVWIKDILHANEHAVSVTECFADESSSVATYAVVVAEGATGREHRFGRNIPSSSIKVGCVALGITGEREVQARAVVVRV
jgi:hypothetical protein